MPRRPGNSVGAFPGLAGVDPSPPIPKPPVTLTDDHLKHWREYARTLGYLGDACVAVGRFEEAKHVYEGSLAYPARNQATVAAPTRPYGPPN